MLWILRILVVLPAIAMMAPAVAAADPQVVGLWRFDGGLKDASATRSPFRNWSRSAVTRDPVRVGVGAYAAIHGDNARTDWREEATGGFRLVGEAQLNGVEAFGVALWVRPVKRWGSRGRLLSFGDKALGIESVAGEPDGAFRVVNAGIVDASDAPVLTLPFDTWTHVAIAANGERVNVVINGEAVADLPQRGGLTASDRLYLGATKGGVGLLSAYFDELVLARGPADAAWAKRLFDQTRSGEPLPYTAPPPPEFGEVERDLSQFLRVEPVGTSEAGDSTVTLTVRVRETPHFGPFIAGKRIATADEVRQVIDDLAAHHCNTVVLSYSWCVERADLLRLFHERGFRVFAIVSPPYGRELVEREPDTARRDEAGDTLKVASFYDSRYVEHVRETFLAEGLAGRGIDGLILDEPAMPGWKDALKSGNLHHAHPAERSAFERMFGRPMPRIELPRDRGTEDFEQLIEFRRRMMLDWFRLLGSIVESRDGSVPFHVVLTPDTVTTERRSAGLTSAEATGVDVERLLEVDSVRGLQITPYLNAWKREPKWLRQFLPLFVERAHERGKGSFFWTQAYLESPAQVERGIQPGDVRESIDLTLGGGTDGMFIWHYRGFGGQAYDWDAYFREFADAAAAHHDRPARGVTFAHAGDGGGESLRAVEVEPGVYRVTVAASPAGPFKLRVTSRAGVVRTATLDLAPQGNGEKR